MIPHSSSTLAAAPDSGADSDRLFPLLRWPILVAASLALVIFTLGRAGAVGAAAPTAYDGTICINYFTCYNTGTGAPVSNTTSGYPAYVAPTTTTTGYPANTVVSTYFDPRYCNGVVSVATDGSGTLIDLCTTTGQRIYPIFPDYGFGNGFVGNGFVGANFVNGTFANGFANNGCAVGNFSCLGSTPFFSGTYADIFTANGCPVGNVACLGFIPNGFFNGFSTGATTTGTTTTGVITRTTTTPGGGQVVVYNPKEVAQPVATATAAQPVAALAPAQAPAASSDNASVKVLSVQTPTPLAANNNDGRDDGK